MTAQYCVKPVHSLPGRIRVRIPRLREQQSFAGWLKIQLLGLSGVKTVRLRPAAASAVLTYDTNKTTEQKLLNQLNEINWSLATESEYEPEFCGGDNLLNLAGLAATQFLPKRWAAVPALALMAPTIAEGLESLCQRELKVEVLDALALSLSIARGDYRTAMLTQSLLTLGEYFEQETSRHSDELLSELMQPQHHAVWVERDGETQEINTEQLVNGDVMLLGPGDNIPADGNVLRGIGLINQASMTGESVPVRREAGAWVFAGTQVQDGNIAVKAERVGDESSTASIRRFITESLSQRSETQQVTQKMADRRVAITLGAGAGVFALTRDWQRLASVFLVDYSCAVKVH